MVSGTLCVLFFSDSIAPLPLFHLIPGSRRLLSDLRGVYDPSVPGGPHRNGALVFQRELRLRQSSGKWRGSLAEQFCLFCFYVIFIIILLLCYYMLLHFIKYFVCLFLCLFLVGWKMPAPLPPGFREASEPLSDGHDGRRHRPPPLLSLCGLQIPGCGFALP